MVQNRFAPRLAQLRSLYTVFGRRPKRPKKKGRFLEKAAQKLF
jgi:hypothetical protein